MLDEFGVTKCKLKFSTFIFGQHCGFYHTSRKPGPPGTGELNAKRSQNKSYYHGLKNWLA